MYFGTDLLNSKNKITENDIISQLANALEPVIKAIENENPLTDHHYDCYVYFIRKLIEKEPRLQLYLLPAFLKAGADRIGVENAFNLIAKGLM